MVTLSKGSTSNKSGPRPETTAYRGRSVRIEGSLIVLSIRCSRYAGSDAGTGKPEGSGAAKIDAQAVPYCYRLSNRLLDPVLASRVTPHGYSRLLSVVENLKGLASDEEAHPGSGQR